MDKRVYLGAGVTVLLFTVLAKTSFLSTVFAFLILGMVPGTDWTIPFWAMLILYPLLFIATIIWISRQSLFIGDVTKPAPARTRSTRSHKTKKKSRSQLATKRTAPKRRPRTAI